MRGEQTQPVSFFISTAPCQILVLDTVFFIGKQSAALLKCFNILYNKI